MEPSVKLAGPSLLDLENMDLSSIFVQTPYMLPLGARTPSSSERSHSDSGSSEYSYLHQHDDMSFEAEDEAMDQYFLPHVANESYYHPSGLSNSQQMLPSYSSAASSAFHDAQQWMSLPMLGQSSNGSAMEAAPPSYVYPAFHTPGGLGDSGTSFIPPPPQSPYAFHQPQSPQPQEEGFLSPRGPHSQPRAIHFSHSRSASTMSRSCSPSNLQVPGGRTNSAPSDYSIDSSHNSTTPPGSSSSSLHAYGVPVPQAGSTGASQTWRCAYPGCTSRALFTRGCDLRKHFNRHSKHLYCRVEGCPQSEGAAAASMESSSAGRRSSVSSGAGGGFSSKKDRARHEAKHNPGVKCEWRGPGGEECGRVFSRMDNMKDHVRRIHRKGSR